MSRKQELDDQAGRVCPYCHTSINGGELVHSCETCSALHHQDCWEEGEGCAVFGCDQPPASERGGGASRPVSRRRPERGGSIPAAGQSGDAGTGGRKLLPVAAAGLILIAGCALIYLLAFGDDGAEKDPRPPTVDRGLSRSAMLARMDARLDRIERAERGSQKTAFERTTDPGGNWTAILPSGSRWTDPEDQGDQNSPDNPRYRTVLWGPSDSFVLIETTPYEDPTENEGNYTIDGNLYPPVPIESPEMLYGELIEFEASSGDCAGLSCAKILLSDGAGGGVAVLVGSQESDLSVRVASEIGSSISSDR